jgi:hypothetical protein
VNVALDGPREYEMTVGHQSDVTLVVEPGSYTVRMASPSVRTQDRTIKVAGGRQYQLAITKSYEPH